VQRQVEWCDELSRTGELFIVLHTNPADGMSYVRAMPATAIDRVEWRPGDYEAELRYHERVGLDDPDYPEGRWWLSPLHPEAQRPDQAGRLPPVMVHLAINRPVGCVRGESDLAPVLPWLNRYTRWLEDRVRLNGAVRAYLWIVKVSGHRVPEKQVEYARPPEPGSVLVIDKGEEEWQAVAPDLKANDAAMDGRAIRWMIVAGGPGTGLVDLGEAETSNLATAQAMGEQRWRVMRQRQRYFGYCLGLVVVTAYNRAVAMGRVQGRPCGVDQLELGFPDISSADNANLAAAAQAASQALTTLSNIGLHGNAFQKLALRLVLRFAGESIGEQDLAEIIGQSAAGGQTAAVSHSRTGVQARQAA
jgi:hypothetical protein